MVMMYEYDGDSDNEGGNVCISGELTWHRLGFSGDLGDDRAGSPWQWGLLQVGKLLLNEWTVLECQH